MTTNKDLGALSTERGTIANAEVVGPNDDPLTVYANASGPVIFGPGVYSLSESFKPEPGKRAIASPAPPGDDTVGTVFRAGSGFSDSALVEPTGASGRSASNFTWVEGITFDANSNVDTVLEVPSTFSDEMRYNRFVRCSFRGADGFGVDVRGGRIWRFIDCDVGEVGQTSNEQAINLGGCRAFSWIGGRVVDVYEAFRIGDAPSNIRISPDRVGNCTGGNGIRMPVAIPDNDEGSIIISDVAFSDGSSQNSWIRISADISVPLTVTGCTFKGEDRSDSSETMNRAVSVAGGVSLPRAAFAGNVANDGFVQSDPFAFRDALGQVEMSGNTPIPAGDLSTVTAADAGTIKMHNGGDGNTSGRYEFDGTDWVGIGAASGTSITPS